MSAYDEVLDAKIIERTSGDYNYWIAATCDEGDLIMHKIASDMNPRWSQQTHSLTWNYNLGGTYGSWAFQFTSPEGYERFKAAFTRAAWETLHRVPWAKIKVGRSWHQLTTYFNLPLAGRTSICHEFQFRRRGYA